LVITLWGAGGSQKKKDCQKKGETYARRRWGRGAERGKWYSEAATAGEKKRKRECKRKAVGKSNPVEGGGHDGCTTRGNKGRSGHLKRTQMEGGGKGKRTHNDYLTQLPKYIAMHREGHPDTRTRCW